MDGEWEQWRQEEVTERREGKFGWDVKIKNNKNKLMPKKENMDGYHT